MATILHNRVEYLTVNMYKRAGTQYIINAGRTYGLFMPFMSLANISQYKAPNKFFQWGSGTATILSTLSLSLAVWYDRYSGIATDVAHYLYIKDSDHDVYYRNYDIATDTYGSEVKVFTGASAADGACMSIVKTKGGNLIIAGQIDAGTEIFARKSTDNGVNWSDITAVMESATQDQIILMPDPDSADNQDCLCFYWDADANEISVKRYDDSGNSWAETSIAGSMADSAATSGFPHFSACYDSLNSLVWIAAWSAVDTSGADLRCWKVTNLTITEVTNVVLNSSDDQGYCALGVNELGHLYCWYAGKSDGSETYNTNYIYYKISKDGGTTWGAETVLTQRSYVVLQLFCTPNFIGDDWCVSMFHSSVLVTITPMLQPHSTFQLGI